MVSKEKQYEDEESLSDKENECVEDDKENDADWAPNENIQQPTKKSAKRGRKPLGEIDMPEEPLSDYEKLQMKRKAEQKAMLEAMKKAAMSLSNAIIPKPVPRQRSKGLYKMPNYSTRSEPPQLRQRKRHNSRGSSNQSSEPGTPLESGSLISSPRKRLYEDFEDDDEEIVYVSYKRQRCSKPSKWTFDPNVNIVSPEDVSESMLKNVCNYVSEKVGMV